MTAAAADLRWCLEQALARHPSDDAAALSLADRMAAFLDGGTITISSATESSGIMAPALLQRSAGQPGSGKLQHPPGTDGRGTGYEGSAASPPVVMPASSAALGPTAAGGSPAPTEPVEVRAREGIASAETSAAVAPHQGVGAAQDPTRDPPPHHSPAPPARKRAPARTDLPLTEGERRTLVALIRVTAPGNTMHWSAALQATGISKPGPAGSMLKRVQNKGYLAFSSEGAARYVRVIRDLAGGLIRSAPAGSHVEHREGLPVPVTICPPRYARGSVQSQFER